MSSQNVKKYTGNIIYYEQPDLFEWGKMEFAADDKAAEKSAPFSPVYARAKEIFNQEAYAYPAPPLYLGQHYINFPQADQYVLRLLIKEPGSKFVMPKKLSYLQEFIAASSAYQREYFPDYDGRFAYLTVRSGEVKSVNDDQLHVDGFQGISVPRHIPEQNYIWASSHPTIFSMQPYFVEELDAGKHNIHNYFQQNTCDENLYVALAGGVYIMDPYHVHKRPQVEVGQRRSFVRLDFSPVEIRDDTCMKNIYLPRGPYGRFDIRDELVDFVKPESGVNHGIQSLTL